MAGELPFRASKGAIARIVNAVRAIEGIPRKTAGDPSGRLGGGSREFWAEIGDATDKADNQWWYDWMEVRRTSTGFEAFDGARDSDTCEQAINSVEENNGSSGIQGNGIDHDGADYPAGFELQPIRGNPVRRMYVDYLADGSAVYTFEASNAEDGTCDGGG